MLLREVNHRSKNLLGVVLSIARQTAKGDIDDYVRRFSDRLQSLAAIQDLLIKSDWQGTDPESLVLAQLGHFSDLIGSRIHIKGEPVFLSPAAAQTLGMALHELATNASKHGALSDGRGQVEIAWQHGAVSAEGSRFTIDWRESNGPPVVAPARRGFGSTVTEAMVKMGLSGDVTVEFPASGFNWRLDCPLEKVLGDDQIIGRR